MPNKPIHILSKAYTALLLLISATAGLTMSASGQTPVNAPFTAEQAKSGESIFLTNCSGCHGYSMIDIFKDFSNLDQFYSLVSLTMPWEDAGSLTEDDYVAIVAYLMGENGFEAGSVPLTADREVLRRIKPTDGRQD